MSGRSIKSFFVSLLAIMIISVAFTSCGKSNSPDNKVYKTEKIADGFKPGASVKDAPVQQFQENVLLKLTWKQANHFAAERADHGVWNLLGVIALLLFAFGFYIKIKEPSWVPQWLDGAYGNFTFWLLAVATLLSFKWQSALNKWGDDVWVPKAQYEYHMDKEGDTKEIWDSLDNGCHLTFGKYDCWNKDNVRIK
jgi:hypothetical protein